MAKSFSGVDPELTIELVRKSVRPNIKGLIEYYDGALPPIIITKKGIVPTDLSLLRLAKPVSILCDPCDLAANRGVWMAKETQKCFDAYLAVNQTKTTKSSRRSFVLSAMGVSLCDEYYDFAERFSQMPIVGRRICIRKNQVKELIVPRHVPHANWSKWRLEMSDDTWSIWGLGQTPAFECDFGVLSSQLTAESCFGFAIVYLDWGTTDSPIPPAILSPLASAWLAKVGAPILSFLKPS